MRNIAIYNRSLATLGGGERYTLAMAEVLSQQHQVTVLSPTLIPTDVLTHRFQLDLSRVNFQAMPGRAMHGSGAFTAAYDYFINASSGDFVRNEAQGSLLLVYFPIPVPLTWDAHLRRAVALLLRKWLPPQQTDAAFLHQFGLQQWQAKLQHILPAQPLKIVDSYDQIWAISRFTQAWIQRYWQRSSQVVYPPVAIEAFSPLPKGKKIISVGRFFRGSHNKKHEVMVRAFQALVEQGLGDWELHLVGGVNAGAENQAYLAEITAQAAGYPIYLHSDLRFSALVKLYGESSIYWHASGFGEDEERDPIKSEHFGITTVEAMAAGCVPVVIAKGGQPELIAHGQEGFLWQTITELQEYTKQVIENEPLRQQMALAAQARSAYFGKAQLMQKLTESLAAFTIPRP